MLANKIYALVHEHDRGHVDRVGAHTTLLHKRATEDDREEAVLREHNGARDSLAADLDGPLSEVRDTIVAVGARSCVAGDKAVVERKAAADVDVAVAFLEHHWHVVYRAEAALEQTHTALRVELLKGNLVRECLRRVGLRRLLGPDTCAVKLVRGRWCEGLEAGVHGLDRRGEEDAVATAATHAAGLEVSIDTRHRRRRNAVDTHGTALAARRRACDKRGLIQHRHVRLRLVSGENRRARDRGSDRLEAWRVDKH